MSKGRSNSPSSDNGTVWATGANWYGQLGDGTKIKSVLPQQVKNLKNIVSISSGSGHSVALSMEGSVLTWGSNMKGQLGYKTKEFYNMEPKIIENFSGVKEIASGDSHNVALKNDGTVWAWGHNIDNQLGSNLFEDSSTPVQVNSLSDISKIASGKNHNLALKSDGTVWTWGSNTNGQLGNGAFNDYNSKPIKVIGLSEIIDIACGNNFSMALKSDGSVWAWGSNANGQFGNSTIGNKILIPVKVNQLSDITDIACGDSYSMFLKKDGTVWVSGGGTYLGNGSYKAVSIPIKIKNISNIKSISAGFNTSMAISKDGSVWAWGSNWLGQLGDGSTMDRLLPIKSFNTNLKYKKTNLIKIRLNENLLETDLSIIPNDGIPKVPIRLVSEALGFNVTWNNYYKTAVIKKDGFYAELRLDSKTVLKDGNLISNILFEVNNDHIIVPLQLLYDLFDIDAKWDETTQFIDIISNEELTKSDLAFEMPFYDSNKSNIFNIDIYNNKNIQSQWGIYNNGQTILMKQGVSGIDINAYPAWRLTTGSRELLVGVLDTGIYIKHKNLIDNIYNNPNEIPNNGIDDDSNGYIDDTNGWDFADNDNSVYDSKIYDAHGTHVAGIIAASNIPNGIIGVAPNVKILPLKIISGASTYISDVIKAIDYANRKGVKIINCSFITKDNYFELKDVMQNTNILFVSAAGNFNSEKNKDPVFPVSFNISNVLSVTVINNKGELDSTNYNFGNNIELAAPGVNILSTIPEDKYEYFSGTSMAAPFVTGVAALLKSYIPGMSYLNISFRIKNNATIILGLKGKVITGGIVNAYDSLINSKKN